MNHFQIRSQEDAPSGGKWPRTPPKETAGERIMGRVGNVIVGFSVIMGIIWVVLMLGWAASHL